VVEIDEFAALPMLYLRSFGNNVVHYDSNPFWISADINKGDLE